MLRWHRQYIHERFREEACTIPRRGPVDPHGHAFLWRSVRHGACVRRHHFPTSRREKNHDRREETMTLSVELCKPHRIHATATDPSGCTKKKIRQKVLPSRGLGGCDSSPTHTERETRSSRQQPMPREDNVLEQEANVTSTLPRFVHLAPKLDRHGRPSHSSGLQMVMCKYAISLIAFARNAFRARRVCIC